MQKTPQTTPSRQDAHSTIAATYTAAHEFPRIVPGMEIIYQRTLEAYNSYERNFHISLGISITSACLLSFVPETPQLLGGIIFTGSVLTSVFFRVVAGYTEGKLKKLRQIPPIFQELA